MTTTTEPPLSSAPERTFRLSRSLLAFSIVCLAFFLLMGGSSVAAAYWNVDGSFPHLEVFALVCGMFWSAFSLLGAYLVALCLRGRLTLSDDRIVQRGAFREQTAEAANVRRIIWRTRPASGSAVLRSDSGKVTIELGNFASDDRKEIMRTLRTWVSEEIQEDWPRFEELSGPPTPFARRASRSRAILTASVLTFVALLFVGFWAAGRGDRYLGLGLVNAAGAILYLWTFRREFRAPEEVPGGEGA